jgi:hypothetical protein
MDDLTGDEFFIEEAGQLERELQQLVSEVSDTLTAGIDSPLLLDGWMALHFLHLAGRLADAVKLCQQIAGYLTVLPELPGPEVPPVIEEEPAVVKRKQPPVRIPWSDLPQ